MEFLVSLLSLAVLVLGAVVLFERQQRLAIERRLEELRQTDAGAWEDLDRRIRAVEGGRGAVSPARPVEEQRREPVPARVMPPSPAPKGPPVVPASPVVPPAPVVPPPADAPAPRVEVVALAAPAAPVEEVSVSAAPPVTLAADGPAVPEPPEMVAPLVPEHPVPAPMEDAPEEPGRGSWEVTLGTQVFLRAGVAVIVLGVLLILGYVADTVGPAGKVGLGLAGSVAAGLVGVRLERMAGWATFGRVVLAGAWTSLFLVVFGARFLPASQVTESTELTVVLLMLVASGSIGFSLRYRQEWMTVFAFALLQAGLGVAAVQLEAPFNLVVTTIAGLGLSTTAWLLRWPRLLLLGSVGQAICLGLWTHLPVVPSEVAEVTGILGTWALLSWPIAWWKEPDDATDRWLGVGTLGLTFISLALGLSRTLDTGHAWMVCGAIGVGALALAMLARAQGRVVLFRVVSTAGLLALALVGPLRLGWADAWAPMMRLIGLEALLVAGLVLREPWFRWLAGLGLLASFADVLLLRCGLVPPMDAGSMRVALLATCSLLAGGNAVLARSPLAVGWAEVDLARVAYSGSATVLLGALVWLEAPAGLVVPLLAVLAVLWQELALREEGVDLRVEASGLAITTLVATLLVTLPALQADPTQRVLALGTAAALFHAGYLRLALRGDPGAAVSLITGTALGLVLLATDGPDHLQGPAAAVIGVTGLAISGRRELGALRVSALTWAGAAIGWCALIHWPHAGPGLGGWSEREVAVLATAALGYIGAGLLTRRGEDAWNAGLTAAVAAIGLDLLTPDLIDRHTVWPLAGVPLVVGTLMASTLRRPQILLAVGVSALAAPLLAGDLTLGTSPWPMLASHGLLVGLAVFCVLVVHREVSRGGEWSEPAVSGFRDGLLAAAAVDAAVALAVELDRVGLMAWTSVAWAGLAVALLGLGLTVELRSAWRAAVALVVLSAGMLLAGTLPWWPSGVVGLGLVWVVAGFGVVIGVERWVEAWTDADRLLVQVGWHALAIGLTAWVWSELPGELCLVAPAAASVGWAAWSTRREGWTPRLIAGWNALLALGAGLLLAVDLEQGWKAHAALPIAAALLLGGWAVLRQLGTGEGWRVSGSRGWLAAAVLLVTADLWAETSGRTLTMALSGEGLGLVGLGFVAAERPARLSGLALLTFCLLKLFLYDLSGLEGLARIGSFIVLGLVLVGVSVVYTRFRDRLL